MKTPDVDRDDEVELLPAEAARDRRRDHDLRAVERAGMRTGLAKQFKQVLDAQLKRGREAEEASGVDERRPRDPKTSHGRRRGMADRLPD